MKVPLDSIFQRLELLANGSWQTLSNIQLVGKLLCHKNKINVAHFRSPGLRL